MPGLRFLRETLVLVPALNEAACVAQSVRDWLVLGVRRVRVVDNGSTDNTRCLAEEAGAEVILEPRRGYGAAAWRGLQDWPPECAWVLFSSADGSDRLSATEAAAWQRAVDGGADLVLGDRTALPDSRAHLTRSQRLGNRICCMAIACAWNRRFRDLASLRLVRRHVIDRMQLRDRGYGWNLEMQVRALEMGVQVVELPVSHFPRRAGQSKISGRLSGTVQAGYGILRVLAHLWRLRFRGHSRRADALVAP